LPGGPFSSAVGLLVHESHAAGEALRSAFLLSRRCQASASLTAVERQMDAITGVGMEYAFKPIAPPLSLG
jgi:hypothetical protein